jgi:sugar/nucleoside kinase (ribokinase family)
MRLGSDVPGRITRVPGGVALNIAMTLRRFGLRPAILTAIGRDPEGEQLVTECAHLGLVTDFAYRSEDLPTDRYMAVEGANGLIAAIADAHSLEAAGEKILHPLEDGRLASLDAPWSGPVALDGNLTTDLLARIATSPLFSMASASVADAAGVLTQVPPEVLVTRVTGAGDTFLAAHVVAEREGAGREEALARALQAAALYVSGDTPS